MLRVLLAVIAAVTAGVDTIEHGSLLDERAARRMIDRGTRVLLVVKGGVVVREAPREPRKDGL